MPRDWGWRYLWWVAWTNMLTIICTIQLGFIYLTADNTLDLSDKSSHRLLAVANLLGIVVAQIKRHNPPKDPPRKKR